MYIYWSVKKEILTKSTNEFVNPPLSRHKNTIVSPAGRFSSPIHNPNTLTRMPPTQYPLSGIAAPPPNSRDAFPSLQQGTDPLGWAQGDPREPQGAQGYRRAPSAPLGGWAHGAPWGYTEAIPNGTPFRLEGFYEGKAIPSVRKPFEWKGRSEWMALPNGKLFHAFTQPRKRRTECLRICLVGFEQFS